MSLSFLSFRSLALLLLIAFMISLIETIDIDICKTHLNLTNEEYKQWLSGNMAPERIKCIEACYMQRLSETNKDLFGNYNKSDEIKECLKLL